MFAKIKRITKPIQKQDFYLPTGEPVPVDRCFPQCRKSRRFWKFKNLPIRRAEELAEDGHLVIRRRVEIKAELHRRFREEKKVRSETKHLASIMERDISDMAKCESFWSKIEDKLKNFELSDAELEKIREIIEADVPRPSNA